MSANQQVNGSNQTNNNNNEDWNAYLKKQLADLQREVDESEAYAKATLEKNRFNLTQSYMRNLENYKFDE